MRDLAAIEENPKRNETIGCIDARVQLYPCIVSIGIAFCFTGGRCSAIDVTSQREADSLERCNVPPANGWRTTVCENIEACRMTHDARHSAIDPCGEATLGRSRSLVYLPEQRMRRPSRSHCRRPSSRTHARDPTYGPVSLNGRSTRNIQYN